MADQWGRVIAGSAGLAALWIAVYWAWEPAPPPITYGSAPPAAEATTVPVDPTPAVPVPAPAPRPVPEAVKPPAPREPDPIPKAVAPEFTIYRVKPGDTLGSIAREFYGTDKHASAIAKANPFKDPQRLRSGEELRVPRDPLNIQGKDTAPPSPAAPPGPSRTYTVRPGDTLSSISKSQYGTVKHADLIYQANRAALSSPDDIRVGQVLAIPPRPAPAAAAGDPRRDPRP